MRIRSIEVSGIPPVTKFHADALSDVVVIAGGNGVGKTRLLQGILSGLSGSVGGSVRLVVDATCEFEKNAWKKSTLELSGANSADVNLYKQTILQRKQRGKTGSTVLNFESDRSIQQIKPLPPSWDMPDPDAESVSHNLLLGGLKNRFQDTQHTIFKKVHRQTSQIANKARALLDGGNTTMDLDFIKDPLDPFKEAFSRLLSPKQLLRANIGSQTLMCGDGGGQIFPIDALSSGEREVVNIAFDFILRQPSDCVIFFDEPELHLHPELSYRLITTLRSIGEDNQFIFCTHSPDIISSSLDDTVIFLTPANGNNNQAVQVKPDDENSEVLGRLGHSVGIVSLGKKIVLIEGKDASTDKKVYDGIVKSQFPSLVLLPSAGKGNITSFDAVANPILNRSIWGVRFFMLVDRDAVIPRPNPNSQMTLSGGPLRCLSKYHLENYFLDEEVLAMALGAMGNEEFSDPEKINALLKEIAAQYVSYAAALSASAKFRREIGNVKIMPKGCHGKSLDDLADMVKGEITQERDRIQRGLAVEEVISFLRQRHESLTEMLEGNEWKNEIPGKHVLNTFCGKVGVKPGQMRNVYVREALKSEENPFAEIVQIFRDFSEM